MVKYSGITVVIPAYNEEDFLPATLSAVEKSQKNFLDAYGIPSEILVVDNASTDKTGDVAAKVGARVIHHSTRNIASVRNAGIQAASFELIVMIDADSFIPSDGLMRIYERMKDEKCVGGSLGVKLLSDRLFMRMGAWVVQSVVQRISGITGAMFFFERAFALEAGGFPEDRLVAEDSAFAIAMQNLAKIKGKRFTHLPSVQIGTLDRKPMNLRTFLTVLPQVFKGFRGRKQTIDDLSYWYKPDR